MQIKSIGPEKALEKIRSYCAYQERCHREVREKLYSFGLRKNEVEEIISRVIEEKFLDEERYAIAFAGGKFRINHWGRVKIREALKLNQVSDYCIRQGLAAIDPAAYEETIRTLLERKRAGLSREKNPFILKHKLLAYMQQKGYEPSLVLEIMKES